MKQVSLLVLLVIVLVCTSFSQRDSEGKLAITVRSAEATYRISDSLSLEIELSNSGNTPLLIRRQLGWGSGRTDVRVFNVNGEEVFTTFLADELPPPFQQGDFIELEPNQFFGQRVKEPVTHFVNKPGTYTLVVDYTQPFTEKFIRESLNVSHVPVWGRERGVVQSNRITLTVTK